MLNVYSVKPFVFLTVIVSYRLLRMFILCFNSLLLLDSKP